VIASSCFLDVFHVKARRHKGRAKRFELVLLLSDPCGLWASFAQLPFDCGCLARLSLLACCPWTWPSGVAVLLARASDSHTLPYSGAESSWS
jgi:hypothetical protein